MNDAENHIFYEEFWAEHVGKEDLDVLLAKGWRHFGKHFTRYGLGLHDGEMRHVMPLRVLVENFRLSKNQRRILRKNADLVTEIRPIEIGADTYELFERHKRRFTSSIPGSIHEFLSITPATVPTDGREVRVFSSERLVAASFFDVGSTAISSIYGMFDIDFPARSLGIYAMLKEIEFAKENAMRYYYPGYAYRGPSLYDYKKRFSATEFYDWSGIWAPLLTENI